MVGDGGGEGGRDGGGKGENVEGGGEDGGGGDGDGDGRRDGGGEGEGGEGGGGVGGDGDGGGGDGRGEDRQHAGSDREGGNGNRQESSSWSASRVQVRLGRMEALTCRFKFLIHLTGLSTAARVRPDRFKCVRDGAPSCTWRVTPNVRS